MQTGGGEVHLVDGGEEAPHSSTKTTINYELLSTSTRTVIQAGMMVG